MWTDLVFHSIRKTVATTLENAEVLEGVTADGHRGPQEADDDLWLYSGGTSFERKAEAIAMLNYAAEAPKLG